MPSPEPESPEPENPGRDTVWSPEAEEDLIGIWGHLAREATDQVADNQLDDIDRACAKLKVWPHSGRPRENLFPGLRSVLAHPYVIFYRVRSGLVEVVRVIHGRRDIDAIFAGRSGS
jgi:toxin ParE1/3/4